MVNAARLIYRPAWTFRKQANNLDFVVAPPAIGDVTQKPPERIRTSTPLVALRSYQDRSRHLYAGILGSCPPHITTHGT